MLFTETVHISDILAAWIPIAYAGVLSCGVAYTLQIVGQKNMNPTAASLILSLESVFSVVGGMLILHQMLSVRELFGCLFLFAAIVLSQIPPLKNPRT
jgi:drug/metabolite transporter (DMT)-like permease